MRPVWKYVMCNAFCLLLLLLTTADAQNTTSTPLPETTAKASATIVSNDLKVEFPEIEGWKRSEIVKYPVPELGYSINYDSREAGRVTIYVYNFGMRNIPSDISDGTVKNEIERSKGEIVKFGEIGYYQNVKELKRDTVVLGGQTGKMKALHSVFNYNQQGAPLVSEIYLLGHQNHFIKIRATYPKVEGETENKALADVLMEIEKLLSK